MQPESRKLLTDMLEAARTIAEFTAGREFPEFAADKLLRSGVYYQFVIIGEALTQLRLLDRGTFDRIPESSRIVGFRNQIIHGYGVIQDNITWQIVQDKLPILQHELSALVAE